MQMILYAAMIVINDSNEGCDDIIQASFFVLDIVTFLMPTVLGPISSRSRSSSLEAGKPFLLVKQTVVLLLVELAPVGIYNHAPSPLILLLELQLLLTVELHPFLLIFYRRVLPGLVVRKTTIA